jgi:hypothetical protein
MNNAAIAILTDLTNASRHNDIAEVSRLLGVCNRGKGFYGITTQQIVAAERAGVGEGLPDFSKA